MQASSVRWNLEALEGGELDDDRSKFSGLAYRFKMELVVGRSSAEMPPRRLAFSIHRPAGIRIRYNFVICQSSLLLMTCILVNGVTWKVAPFVRRIDRNHLESGFPGKDSMQNP